VALRLFLLVSSAPTPPSAGFGISIGAADSTYWLASIERQGTVAFGASDYKVFRNVKDYGAAGDGRSTP
jgi:hypothetical protein